MNNLHNWYLISEKLKLLKKQELEFRKAVVAEYFPEITEGANRVDVDGAVLIANLPYSYTLDVDGLEAAMEHIPDSKKAKLITSKPAMSLPVYRGLSKKAMTAFAAECLSIKPGSPTLKIEVPTDA